MYGSQKETKEDSENSKRNRNHQESGSRIIFPKKANGEARISEQELRFIFVEQFNQSEEVKNNNLFYSVETPTIKKYEFKKDTDPNVGTGVSARTDLTIHNDKFTRVALIEFKALNPRKESYSKDIFKLKNEGCPLKYFIQIIKKL